MKLAFCLFKYFPYGGMERNCLTIANLCRQQGHQVVLYVAAWDGPLPLDLEVRRLPVRALTNHGKVTAFIQRLRPLLQQGGHDGVVGFLKMPGLDVFYTADPCYQAQARRRHGPLYRLTRRYRRYTALEAAVFNPASRTAILLLSAAEMADYQHCYGTPHDRFHLLPPGINRDRMAPPDAPCLRAEVRRELGVADSDRVVLLVGSDFRRKGLDRALLALAALPTELCERTRLLVVGQAAARPFARLAGALGVSQQVRFLGGRDDVPRLLLGADLLIHPAYTENTGNVLLEAIIAGLPVLTTANCGYAFHVERAAAGRVVPVPFVQEQLNAALAQMLTTPERERWAQNGIAYGRQADLYSRPQAALAVISQVVQEKGGR